MINTVFLGGFGLLIFNWCHGISFYPNGKNKLVK